MMVLPVPVVDHISKCIDKLLLTQTLSDENRSFCNVCNAKQNMVETCTVCRDYIRDLLCAISKLNDYQKKNLILLYVNTLENFYFFF